MLLIALENKGWTCEIRSFSTKVKWIAECMYRVEGLRGPEFYDEFPHAREEFLPMGKTPRQLWEDVGTMGRQIWGRTWLNPVLSHIKSDVLIVPDVRWLNECDAILDRGGELYRVDRKQAEQVSGSMDDRLATFGAWTGVIKNHGSLDDLSGIINSLAERVSERLERNRG